MPVNRHKSAKTDHPVHDLVRDRYSPCCFDHTVVEPEKLLACLEAARWSASSFNEQPWTFLVARRGDGEGFARFLACLYEPNQAWAKMAGVLLMTAVCRTFTGNGKPNSMAEHDLGLAVGNLSLQATALGLAVHEMAGIDREKVREVCGIPDSHEPFTALAMGYAADPDLAEGPLADRDRALRRRKAIPEFVFTDVWGRAWPGR